MTVFCYNTCRYGFSLEETNCRDQAEEVSKNALFLQPLAVWATHTICEGEKKARSNDLGLFYLISVSGHVIEEERDPATGIEFCLSSRQNWKECGLENHIAWHLTLFYLGKKTSCLSF